MRLLNEQLDTEYGHLPNWPLGDKIRFTDGSTARMENGLITGAIMFHFTDYVIASGYRLVCDNADNNNSGKCPTYINESTPEKCSEKANELGWHLDKTEAVYCFDCWEQLSNAFHAGN